MKLIQIIDEWRRGIENMESQIDSPNPKSFKDLKLKRRLMTPDEDMARVNPYIKYRDEFKINCPYCVAAYDLRRRGYDVQADFIDINPDIFEVYSWWTHSITRDTLSKQRAFDRLYPGYRYFETNEYQIKEIEDAVRVSGVRGQIMFVWKQGKAHSVIYEVNYGKVLLRDCQHNRKLNFEDYAKLSKRIYFFPIDNEQPTNKILNCVKNSRGDSYFGDRGSLNTLSEMLKREGYNSRVDGKRVRVDLKNRFILIDKNGAIEGNILNEESGQNKRTRKVETLRR